MPVLCSPGTFLRQRRAYVHTLLPLPLARICQLPMACLAGQTIHLEAAMFFWKSKPVICAVCGKPIGLKERRFVDKNRITKEVRHTHLGCGGRDH